MKNFLNLFGLMLLASCSVQVPNIRVCAVAGKMLAGANCAYTLSDKKEIMNFEQLVLFLEATPDSGPAICSSAEDWGRLKTALEQACEKLGSGCTYEMTETMRASEKRLEFVERGRGK